VWSRNLEHEEAKARYGAVKIQPQENKPTNINDNNAVINSNYGRLQDLILLLQIPHGTQMNFFEIYRQFGNGPSRSFASPAFGECFKEA
jgi:hypothetical protein